MIEKRQRLIRRERRQPKRETGQLHGGRVQIDTKETALRDLSPETSSVAIVDVPLVAQSVANQGTFVGARKIPARGHKERSTAHGRIDDSQLQNLLGRRLRDKRM